MEPLRIYVAGPYSPPKGCKPHDISRIVQQNVDKAVEMGNKIIDKGHYAFVPHLSHYIHTHHSCKVNRGVWYYEYDDTFLERWANALFYIAPSYGTDEELKKAIAWGYRIFRSLDEVPVVESGWVRV